MANGAINRQILFHYDFFDESDPRAAQLTLRGQDELMRIAGMVMHTGIPLLIERTPGNPELDERRRQNVVAQVSSLGIGLPADMVIVGKPAAIGRADGNEHDLIYQNQLLQTQNLGFGAGGGGGGGGGASLGGQ